MPRARKMPAKKKELAAHYEATNRESAGIILAGAERYGGADSLMVRWARMILAGRQGSETPAAWRLVA